MKTSIYIGYHSNVDLIHDDIFKYIYCGASINGEENYIKNTLRDDTSDNISHLNKRFCECTALYWIWKNDNDSDYIGFMHYRRHLNFSPQTYGENRYGVINYNNICDSYIKNFGLNKQTIEEFILGKDIILPQKYNCKENNFISNYNLYNGTKNHHIENMELLEEIIKRDANEYINFYKKHINDNYAYYTNIFLMKREIFNEYCSFLFPLLFKLDANIDYTYYNQQEQRAVAFISERIFDIYMRKLSSLGTFKITECQRTFINYPSTHLELDDDHSVPIIIGCDNNFIKFASACICSIIKNCNINKKYSIYILHCNVSNDNMNRLERMVNEHYNFSIKFINCNHIFDNLDLPIHKHFSRATYYRFCIPNIFKKFKKILYLDADTIILKDISELYDIPIDGYAIAGVEDYIFEGMCLKKIPSCAETGGLPADIYASEYLKIDYNDYIQAGVLIFNIQYILENKLDAQLYNHLDKRYWFVDQDIINIVFYNQKLYLDIKWNVANGNDALDFYTTLPVTFKNKYFEARKNPFIIHFAGSKKPWLFPHVSFADDFWKYARLTPFYEEIILHMCLSRGHHPISLRHMIKQEIFPQNSIRRAIAKKIYIFLNKLYMKINLKNIYCKIFTNSKKESK